MKLTYALWDRYGSLTVDAIPDDARTVAGQCVLDWFACAMAGSREPLSEILRAELAEQAGRASVVGTGLTTSITAAALLNGAAGHALDFDDTHITMGGHPTVPVLPAALALAQELGSSGAELLAAYVVGVEVESRIGALVGGAPYRKGWHSTSTLGIFGAAAAACRLMEADRQQFGHAIGLAGSQSSGLKANFGTMTKPFHAGHAAERGLLSARLAMRGFTANPQVIEGRQGYAEAAASGASDLHWQRLEELEERWLIQDTLFKYHAACYLTHAAIESVGELRPRIGSREVERAIVNVHPGLLDVCGIARPKTGLEAKFSLTATTSLALLGIDTTSTATFVDETLENRQLQQLIERVEIETDHELGQTQSRVRLEAGGEGYVAFHDTGVPASDLVQQRAKLSAKFEGLVAPILGREASEELRETSLHLETVRDVASLGRA